MNGLYPERFDADDERALTGIVNAAEARRATRSPRHSRVSRAPRRSAISSTACERTPALL